MTTMLGFLACDLSRSSYPEERRPGGQHSQTESNHVVSVHSSLLAGLVPVVYANNPPTEPQPGALVYRGKLSAQRCLASCQK
jgi:hypothetical protein